MEKFVPSRLLIEAMGADSANLVDFTDVAGIVGLITVDFVESKEIDEATIPVGAATFATKTSGAQPDYQLLPEIGSRALVWPDPVGGWNFISIAASPSGFCYGYRVDAVGGNFIGAKKFSLPIPVTAGGVHVIIGAVSLPVNAEGTFDGGPSEIPG